MDSRPLTLQVPAGARAAWLTAFERGRVGLVHGSTTLLLLDTPDRRLASKGLQWTLQREGRKWTQRLQDHRDGAAAGEAHGVPVPTAAHDATLHAHTPAGERLLAQLRKGAAEGLAAGAWLRFDCRHTTRRIRTQGTVVSAVFAQGRLTAGAARQTVAEVTLTRQSGPALPLYALAQLWCRRHGLLIQPRDWRLRGQRLVQRDDGWPARKGERVAAGRDAGLREILARTLDECLDQILHNGCALAEGRSGAATEQVHQLRVGIRRLRSALRLFEDLELPAPPPPLQPLRELFAELGRAREGDVLASGVAAALQRAGAPPLPGGAAAPALDPHALLRSPATQGLLLDWLCWRDTVVDAMAAAEPVPFGPQAAARLKRWQRKLAGAAAGFAQLDETSIHALRKRIKRQRYALEFLAPVLRRQETERYLRVLAQAQEALGELNDLFTARAHYQARVEAEPAAWFALGWLSARIAEQQAAAAPIVARIQQARAPTA